MRTAEFAPIFDWSAPARRKVPLLGFLAASAAGHALCFYLFQIVYPVTVALSPPPARIDLITADTEPGRVLLRWLEAEDPALASTTQRPTDSLASLPAEPAHVPSYLRHEPALQQLPPLRADLRIPSAQPPGPVPLPRPAAPTPAPLVHSRVQFAVADAASLGAPVLPPLQFNASSADPPAAAEFRIAIGARGTVQNCFLEHSSGDPALDEQARRVLLLSRFPAMPAKAIRDDESIWTTATIQWGSDLSPPAKHSPEAPAP
ncbi:MAG: TonB C-terminal domain-containing protein [Chthoniobacterales bacterium]